MIVDKKGQLLVADDVGNVIWNVKGSHKTARHTDSNASEHREATSGVHATVAAHD